MRDAIAYARELGATVTNDSEVIFTYPGMPMARRACSKTDAGPHTIKWLKRLDNLVHPPVSTTTVLEDDPMPVIKPLDLEQHMPLAPLVADILQLMFAGPATISQIVHNLCDEERPSKVVEPVFLCMRNSGLAVADGLAPRTGNGRRATYWRASTGGRAWYDQYNIMQRKGELKAAEPLPVPEQPELPMVQSPPPLPPVIVPPPPPQPPITGKDATIHDKLIRIASELAAVTFEFAEVHRINKKLVERNNHLEARLKEVEALADLFNTALGKES
jgi:hypothetical protein